jgi:hypothetical protein
MQQNGGRSGELDIGRELRAASDTLVQALTTLHDLELEKRRTPLGTPRFVELARHIEELAREVLASSEQEGDLAEEIADLADSGRHELAASTIEQQTALREVPHVLSEWREAERALASVPPDSHEASRLRLEIGRLRAEYRLAMERATSTSDVAAQG